MTMVLVNNNTPILSESKLDNAMNKPDIFKSEAAMTSAIRRGQSTSDTLGVTCNNSTSNDSSSDQQLDNTSKNQPQTEAAATTCVVTVNASVSLTTAESEEGVIVLPEDFAKKLAAQVQRRLDAFLANSPYIRNNTELKCLPRLSPSQLNLGQTIAKGGFSNIIEINAINTVSEACLPSNREYVVKCLNNKLALKKLPGATKDIVFEAHTLASLKHDNIVQLRGWSHEGIAGFESTLRADGFFLILDRLEDTLFQRVFTWQNELKGRGKYAGLKKQVSPRKILRHQLHEKIQIVVDVASALAYCHEKRIIHRDIKSANVAFDREGRAKLIDFGLAVELPAFNPLYPHQTFELTGNIGTARYMSPECILERPYNEKSDVHSFAVLCWEACAAKKPYSSLDAKKVKEHVSRWNERPKPYWSWPRRLRKVLKQGWAKRPEERPSMAEFHKTLLKVQASLPESSIDFSKAKSQ